MVCVKNSLVKTLILNGQITPGAAVKDSAISSYTYYNMVRDLEWLGIASTMDGKTVLSDNPIAVAFKRLFFE